MTPTRVHEKSFEAVCDATSRGSPVDSRTGPFKRIRGGVPEARLLLRAGFLWSMLPRLHQGPLRRCTTHGSQVPHHKPPIAPQAPSRTTGLQGLANQRRAIIKWGVRTTHLKRTQAQEERVTTSEGGDA